ncbi:PREDICTED: uncharacterized protein LOC104822635 [Tarenaya hassleriana]|uniref:uncharacterized protein LOC104822635 n=1 Tax=Tarenaya hassleriana TaxID=28532 RepID=UPI00053C213F|nr:PREDICTED: uncharacterized protein LOC104822635 [Tarenaya hassleriana]
MADTISNPRTEPSFFSVDPMSLILSQNSDSHELKLLVDDFCGFERGPRYGEYSRLREAKLRVKRDFEKFLSEEDERFFGGDGPKKKMKHVRFEDEIVVSQEQEDRVSPERKRPGRLGGKTVTNQRKSSVLAQSVPDFSAVIRKENRRPATNPNALPRHLELTPPAPSSKIRNTAGLGSASARGSKSASAGEKKSRVMGMAARKSYASIEDLKKISRAAAPAINGHGGGRKAVGGGRTILGYRQLY